MQIQIQYKKSFSVAALTVLCGVLISGCGGKKQQLDLNTTLPTPISSNRGNLDKNVTISAHELPATTAFKYLCQANNLPCDLSFSASTRYKVSTNYEGNLRGLLELIKEQSGVDIVEQKGILKIANKTELVPAADTTVCASPINISFKNTPITDVFKYFAENFGFSFSFDLKFTELSTQQTTQQGGEILTKGQRAITKMPKNVTWFYAGCDKYTALESFLSAIDMVSKETREGHFEIKDSDLAIFDKSLYFNYKFSGGSASGGGGGGSTGAGGATQTVSTGSSGGGSSSGTSQTNLSTAGVSLSEDYKKEVEALLAKYLSPDGKLTFSGRGTVIVEDRPSFIKKIQTIIKNEIQKETPLKITLNIIRIDLNDDYKTGVDWSGVLGRTNGVPLRLAVTGANMFNGGGVFKAASGSTTQILAMLQQYGKTRIEHSWNKQARSGLLTSFEASEDIPYLTNTTTVSGTASTTQSSETLNFKQAGITINMLPSYNQDTKMVSMSLDLAIAQYVGDKTFDQGAGGVRSIPIIKNSKDMTAAEVKIGETVILTGFKMGKREIVRQGLPVLSQIPIVGALAGYQGDESSSSEIIVTITPELAI